MVLDKSTGEGVIRAKDKMDCELQKEHTFTIQAYDCGEGPDGANMKKSHKWVGKVKKIIEKPNMLKKSDLNAELVDKSSM